MSKTRMGKRVASLLLSLVMMLSLLPTTVYATEDTVGGTGETNGVIVEETNTSDDNTVGGTTGNPELTGEDEGGGAANVSAGETATVATIGSATYESLDEAITAVADGETIVVNAGEYTLNGSLNYTGKAFTIAAAEGADVSFDMSAAVALHGAKITFNNVTFDYKTNGNYIGLQHTDTLVYNNCTINGMVFLYAVNETFNGCTFNQTSAGAYNVWTYGAQNVAFNGCTFNCVGRCVLVYNEGAIDKTDLTVENTEFNASAPAEGKAAIEIDTSLMEGGATITVDDKTTAAGFAAGSKSGSTLWNDKKQTADTNKNTTVTVAGETVFEPKAAVVKPVSVNGTSYATLEDAIDAATPDANGVITYEISGKVNVTATGWVQVAKAGLTGLTAVKFMGATDDAAIYVTKEDAVLADQVYGNVDVSFSGLTLVKENPTYLNDYAEFTQYFAMEIRATVKTGVVTYTDCKFPEGVINNTYGKTVFTGCEFSNDDSRYNLWVKEGEVELNNGAFTGTRGVKLYNTGNAKATITVKDTTFDGLTGKAAIVVSQPAPADVTLENVTARNCTVGLIQKDTATDATIIKANGESISGTFNITNAGNAKNEFNISAGTFTSEVSNDYCADGFEVKANDNGTYGVVEAPTAAGDGTEANPYTLEQLGTMTRQAYIDAQNRLNGTMYVTVGDYTYGTNGVLGNGVRDDTTGQIPDHSKLNAYGENGYLGEKNDGANGKSVVFVGGSITSGVTGYTSIDKIGTSLLLALPAYTNVTFKGTTFNNVMSFNYQLYTSPWSQLGELKFDGCTFNGIIVGAIAAQTLTFNRCEFKNYTNTTDANNSNPTWIRPAYGNWTQGDNEGQGSDFKSLTTINFTDNKVTSTRPVKFEYISQWNITSTVTATGNSFDISKQDGDTTIKNVGLYLGAHTDANAFNLVAENNTKSANTAALYTIPEGKTSLPLGSTVKDTKGNEVELTDALKWKAGDATTDKIVLETVEAVASVGTAKYITLAAAIAAAKDGETVTLLKDLDLSATGLTIAANKDVTLDLNGKTLKVANTNSGNIKVVGKLTLQDSTDTAKNGTGTGKVWTETPYISGKQDKVLVAAIDGGTFIMESGLIDAASSIADNANNGQFAVSVQNENADATVIINGGCIKAGWYAIAGNGGDTTYNGNITVNGGILESTADYAIYHPHSGTTTINGGVVFGAAGGVSLNRGKLIVNDGIITSKGTGTTGDWGDGTGNQNAAAINVNAQYGLASVEIKGGKITAEKDAILLTNGKDGTISVSGGTFSSAVKEEYCATGYIPTANADGTYGVKAGAYVAKVDNVKYETLQAAINAAKGGSTVRLLADVTLTETAVFPAGKKVDLNLMGHNITATGTALRINGTTDIQSTGGNGTIESTGNVAVAVGNNAKVTVYSGTLKGREGAVITGKSTGATIEIRYNATLIATDNAVIAGNGSQRDGKPNTILVKGSTFIGNIETKGYIACGIYAPWKDNVTVSGGTFNITNGAGIVARAGTVKVTGGTFNCTGTAEGYVGDSKNKVPCAALVFDEAANYPALTESSQILVSGGSFSTDPAVNGATLAAGYVANKDESGMYKVAKANPVAAIGDVKYDTLQAAITAAQDTKDGATITLLTDINTSSYYEVKGENPVTIDLAGHNITGSGISGLFYVTAKGDLTIKGEGTVTAVEDNGAAMAVWVRSPIAKVTLEGGTYTQQITNTADPHFDLIYVERGNVYVEGGTYKGFTPDWTLNCYDEHYQSKEANIEVTGGTFVGFDPANNKAEGENTNFVPAGYVSTKGADGNYTVEEYKPVEVWTGYSGAKVASYATVAEAAEKLDGNKWIVIGKDYTLTEDFTIGGENLDNLYLDVAEGATLTVAEGVTLTVAANAKRLGVRDGATLVNKGTIVVCGSSTSNGFAMLYGTFTGNELTVPEGCFLDNNGKNFFATANENAVYEITFGDGTVKKTADSTNIKGGNVKQIKLLKDVTNGGWTLDSSSVGAEVVLDLNGHTISYNGANRYYATLNVYTKVTIKNGTVKYEGSKRGAIDLVGQGDLTIERDVTIDGGDGFAIFTSGTSKLTVNGKVTANGNYAIAGNGSKDAGGYIDSCDIIVNGGAVISASKGIAIYHPERGTVTINGGTITGHTGIEMCAGQLVVNGGGITSNGDNMDATGSQNAILDGAAISIINRNYPGGVPTAVIKGGTFAANGKDAQTVKAYDYTGDKVAEWTAAGDNVNISGGTFSSIPTNMGVLCADGYKTVYDAYADMYNVVKQDAKITVGKRLSIGNDLTITYLVSLTDCTNPWVKFQFYNDDIKGYTTVEVKNYGTDTVTGPDGKPMDVFTFDFTGINPQRMTDTLKATVYAKDANGNVVEYQVDDYSVAQYCSNKLAKLGQNDPLRKLIGNLVAYGAAAQVYQNYRTDNLVSTVVSGAVSTDYTDRLSSVTQYTEKVLGTAGVNIKGKTLVLSNTFAVRVYFTVNEGVDIANVSFNVTANGKTDTVNSFEKDEKLGYYYFDYANLNATQLDSEVKFESFVNETGVGDMVTYSVNTYLAKKMPNYDKSSNAYKLMAELFNYGCACTEYASK